MRITRLSVAKLRAFEQASFEFDPRFTLLVGVNGMGKTTVLDTLRICLSRLLPRFTASKSRPEAFGRDDIQVGASALTVDLDLTIHGEAHHLLIHKQREQSVPHKDGVVREQTLATPTWKPFRRASARQRNRSRPRKPNLSPSISPRAAHSFPTSSRNPARRAAGKLPPSPMRLCPVPCALPNSPRGCTHKTRSLATCHAQACIWLLCVPLPGVSCRIAKACAPRWRAAPAC
ncbi:AAA family ATPase [Azospirillum formosense]|uniref:AAA family ATPase n=1 Tax=Azospirillum formosense TaxID=861533 RepID=UPI001C923BAD|nr:AAA family ATPase [Azospirillum formosense]